MQKVFCELAASNPYLNMVSVIVESYSRLKAVSLFPTYWNLTDNPLCEICQRP